MFPLGNPFDSDDWRDEDVLLTAPAVMAAWHTLVDREVPWATMPADDRRGHLGRLTAELLDFSVTALRHRRKRLERAARRHGEFRRDQGATIGMVRLDFAALRQSLRDALRGAGAAPITVREATRCLLPDWRIALKAAHNAYTGR